MNRTMKIVESVIATIVILGVISAGCYLYITWPSAQKEEYVEPPPGYWLETNGIKWKISAEANTPSWVRMSEMKYFEFNSVYDSRQESLRMAWYYYNNYVREQREEQNKKLPWKKAD